MLELPEALARARELNNALTGKTIANVLPPASPRKFCWFSAPVEEYVQRLKGHAFVRAEGFGIFTVMDFGEVFLCFNDGASPRLLTPEEKRPANAQLTIEFTDGAALAFTVTMYGGMYLHDGNFDNEYYRASRNRISPLSDAFTEEYLQTLIQTAKPSLSVKALLATEQRIPGLGNGVLQDILLDVRVHPKRRASSLSSAEIAALHHSIRSVLAAMAESGGRDTERNLHGHPGGYPVKMGKRALSNGCPACGGAVAKETYLGGAICFCPSCQPLS